MRQLLRSLGLLLARFAQLHAQRVCGLLQIQSHLHRVLFETSASRLRPAVCCLLLGQGALQPLHLRLQALRVLLHAIGGGHQPLCATKGEAGRE